MPNVFVTFSSANMNKSDQSCSSFDKKYVNDFSRHLFIDFFCLKFIHSEICVKRRRKLYSFIFQKLIMDALNLRLAEEKNFHSEILLFSFNPEHDIIVVCSANGDVCSTRLLCHLNNPLFLSRSSLIKHIFAKSGHSVLVISVKKRSVLPGDRMGKVCHRLAVLMKLSLCI